MRKITQIILFCVLVACVFVVREAANSVTIDTKAVTKFLLKRRSMTSTVEFDSRTNDYCDGLDFADLKDNPTGSLVDTIKQSRSDQFKNFVDDGDAAAYGMSLIPAIAPWIVLFIFSLFGYFVYCCCNFECCSKCCKNKKPAETKCQKVCPVIFFLVGATTVIACAVAGIIYSSMVPKSYRYMKCAIGVFISGIMEGMHPDFVEDIDNYTWLGLQGTMDLNGELETKLKANQADFDAFNDNYDPTMDIAEAAADQDIADLTSYFTGLKVYDPATEDEDAIPKYVSEILVRTEALAEEKSTLIDVVTDPMKDVKDAVGDFSTELDARVIQINDGQKIMQDFYDIMKDYREGLYDQMDTLDIGMGFVGQGFMVYFIIMMSCLITTLVGTILLFACKKNCCKCFNHLGWCVISIFLIIGFLFLAIMVPVAVVLTEACDYMEFFFTEDEIDQHSSFLEAESAGYLKTCFFGDGNLLRDFDLEDTFSFADDTKDGISDVEAAAQTLRDATFTVTIAQIDEGAAWAGDLMGEACVSDVGKEFMDDLSSCTEELQWVESECSGVVEDPGDTDANECVGLDGWTTAQLSTRYGIVCTVGYGNDVESLNEYEEAISTLFASAGDREDSIQKILEDHLVNLDAVRGAALTNVDLLTTLTGKTEALLDILSIEIPRGLTCNYMFPEYQRLHTAMCQGMIPTICTMVILVLVISVVNIMNVITTTCINRRLGVHKDEDKTKGQVTSTGKRRS